MDCSSFYFFPINTIENNFIYGDGFMTQIDTIMNNEENIDIIAEEIKDIFVYTSNDDNISYSFNAHYGKITIDSTNTFFVFDTPHKTMIEQFKKAMFAEDLSDIQPGSVEEDQLMNKIREFVAKICKKITSSYKDEIETTIRRVVFGCKADKETIPLNRIEVIMMDIADYDPVPDCSKYLLKIFKEQNEDGSMADVNTEDITVFIQNRQEETGMTPREIFLMEKKIGNRMFEGVADVEVGKKFLHDITLYLFVDYSLKTDKIDIHSLEFDIDSCKVGQIEKFCEDYRETDGRTDVKNVEEAMSYFIDDIGDIFNKKLTFKEAFRVEKLSEFLENREKIEEEVKKLKSKIKK